MKLFNKKLIWIISVILMMSLIFVGCSPKQSAKKDTNGLVLKENLKLKYGNNFGVDYFENDYKVIKDGLGRKILYVPEGKEVPENNEEYIILKGPVKKVGCFSTTSATYFTALNSLDKVGMVTTDAKKWHIPEIKKGLEEGKIDYVGKNSDPDYEKISASNPDVILVTTNTAHGSDEVLNKFDELGIKWIAVNDHIEGHPLGRLEWIKLVGALIDKDKEAETYFAEQEAKVLAVQEKTKGLERPKVLQTFILKGTVYVKNGGNYVAEMINLAGGDYVFKNLKPEDTESTKMTVEDFYKDAREADILIYDVTSDKSVKTAKDILNHGDYLSDVKAIENGNVWGIESHYWQSAHKIGDIIEDMHKLIYMDPANKTKLEYYSPLDKE